MSKPFKIGDVVKKSEFGQPGRVVGFVADGRVKVEFRSVLWFRPDELRPAESKDGDRARPNRDEEPQRRLSRLGPVDRYRPD
jgi:hypothetical protein